MALVRHDLRARAESILNISEYAGRELASSRRRPQVVEQALRDIAASARDLCIQLENLHLVSPNADLRYGKEVEFSIENVRQEICDTLQQFPRSNRKLEVIVSSNIRSRPTKLIDRSRLRHLLNVVLANALMYACAKSPISISVSDAEQVWTIEISNCSVRLASDFAVRCFDIGWRDPGGIRRATGPGFGLRVAKVIAESSGWDFKVSIQEGTHDNHQQFIATLLIRGSTTP